MESVRSKLQVRKQELETELEQVSKTLKYLEELERLREKAEPKDPKRLFGKYMQHLQNNMPELYSLAKDWELGDLTHRRLIVHLKANITLCILNRDRFESELKKSIKGTRKIYFK